MTFETSELLKVARLARLALTKEEIEQYRNDLSRIVSYVELLNEVDIEGIEPMCYAGDRGLPLREDIGGAAMGRRCIASSQGYEEGLVRVPKIIE